MGYLRNQTEELPPEIRKIIESKHEPTSIEQVGKFREYVTDRTAKAIAKLEELRKTGWLVA